MSIGWPDDVTPGSRVFRVYWDNSGNPAVHYSNYVHRKGSWRRYRNIDTGAEWNEQGFEFSVTIMEACDQSRANCLQSIRFVVDSLREPWTGIYDTKECNNKILAHVRHIALVDALEKELTSQSSAH